MEEKRCLLCDKPYDYKYEMFGRGCLDNIYELLNFNKPPKFIGNKELYLCTKIAWKNHKFFLSKTKKFDLTKKYIALSYLKKIKFSSLENVEEKIQINIRKISPFSKAHVETMDFSLNDVYKAFNYYQKFEKIIENLQNVNWKAIDKEIANEYIQNLSFIFDLTKKTNIISYITFYSMQYSFWRIVVIGGLFSNKPLSAKLLTHSLSLFGSRPNNLVLEDEEIKQVILKSDNFKNRLKQLIEKYGNNTNKFIVDEQSPTEDNLIEFESADLLYALHSATLLVNALRDENNKWNFKIEIKDRYDFTDFKGISEYIDNPNDRVTDVLSTTLNNLGVVSSNYGVIKVYDVDIKFETKEGEF